MDEVNNYAVIGLEHIFAMRDELTLLRKAVEDRDVELYNKDCHIRDMANQILHLQEQLVDDDSNDEEDT